MNLKAGDVVALRSGGHPLTVASVSDDNIECLWIGEEGDLFLIERGQVLLRAFESPIGGF